MTSSCRTPAAGGGYVAAPPRPDARLRLVCFHHAGGAASAFAGWPEALPADVAVVPVQLPGREGRIGQPRLDTLAAAVDELDRHLDQVLTPPYVLYGHSMGAAVAAGLAARRERSGRPGPERLVVGAARPPHLPPVLAAAARMPDQELARLLVDIGGMTPMLLDYPQWYTPAVRLLRDDLRLLGGPRLTYRLGCPIDAFAGAADPLVPAAEMAGWDRHTVAGCVPHLVGGGHFFLREPGFARALAGLLRPPARPVAAAPGRGPAQEGDVMTPPTPAGDPQ